MKKALSLLLILVMLIGMMPMQAFATEGTQETEAVEVVTEPTEAPEEETTAPAEETEPSDEEEEPEPSDEEEETEPSEPSEPEEEPEVVHEHDYEAVVTEPTCTEQGYTTYTCECGDSYVDDYLDATGHTYKNGICTGCGEEDYDGLDLNGLNVLCLGDSITAGQGLTTETRWTNVLASKYGWNLTNKSQAGISLSSYYYTTNGKSNVSIAKKAEILKTMTTQPDVIIVWGGHNDTSYRYSPLGTWDDETTDSFKGALKYIAELADEYAPDATLFVLTPLWTTEAPSTLKVPENTTDNNWMFVDAIYEGAEAYGWIPVNMDLCGITPFTKLGLLLDNIHPNEAGTEKIVAYLSAELASYSETSKKETIIFNASAVSMKPGESTTLKAVLSPRSGTGTMTFTWSSSDSSVATVDASGKITAVAPGTAVITATAPNGISADISVSVVCEHTYEPSVTAPTCTEQGYTTYTCECGNSYVDDYVDATVDHTYENGICTGCGEKLSFEGKTISILGDSISTYAGISDDSTVNATLSGSTIYYGQGALGGYRHTWWQQIIDTLGMDLLVNNSWSGTCVLKTRGTVGAYIDRCVQLHNDRTGEQPDVIAVFLGTNDYSYYQSTLGTAEIDYAALITDRGDGTFDYAKPTTTCEAYAIMLHKMTQRYPDAEIYCLGMLSRRDPDHDGREVVPPPTSFNAELKAIVERFGGTYVDVESVIPATASEFDQYMIDRRVHPNAAGMDKITEAVVGTMLQRQVTLRNVSYDLHNVSCSKEPAAVIENEPFELTLTATDKDLDLAVRVTMGGEDITSECYANGKVSIAKITGDIVITAMVLHGPSDYQWQFDNGELVSAGTNANQLTKLAGSTQDNVFSQTRYQLAVTAELIHTRPWVIEWAGEGKGGFMLSQTSSSTGAPFFFRRSGNYLTAFGHYNNNRYDNYGLTLDAANIDGAAKHVYRLENRIAQNGNNMVWLLVDGIEIGALNNYYISGTSQGSTADWISGKDFHINYIGSSTHPLSGYALEYLSITECAHIFSNGICTGCGATQPGPVITQQPESVEQEIGKKFAITVKAEGDGLTYQWYVKENGAKAFKVSVNKTSSYAYTMQTYMHNRQVYCVITDANGNSVQTDTATITRPPQALRIVEQPQDAQQEIGQKFSISPKVEGDGLTYQWYVKESGAKAFKVSSNKTSAYAYTMQSYMKGRQVYCVITDKYGNSVTTDVATISLPPVELKILEQPSDVYAVKGEKFSISFVVQGDGLTYQWYYKESYMKDFKPSSNKTSAYAYTMQNYMDGRSVYCVITDQYGNQITTEIVTIDEDDGIYYLTESAEGTYTIYTLAKDGSRKYELNFTGTMNSNTNTITVTKVTSYPAEGVIIPALTTYTADKAVYAVSINPASPFADLGTMSASVSIIPVDGKKVGLTSTVLSNMFKRNNGTNFVSLDLSGLDTSNVTTMSYMFNGCSTLTELDLSGFDTANVTNMSTMFNGCSGLTELDVSGFDTAKVTNMYYMFGSCSGLTELDLSGFDTANVTNMANMFRGCSSLTELDVSGFDTAKVTNMSWMFSGCKNLYDLDLSNWDMSKANTANMFYNCPAGA